jgi:protein tyrosine/serine phosphatase
VMHCKSGADRAGLMSVLYCHTVLGWPIAQAKSQLALRFGHIRQADTGILDHFFEEYLRFAQTNSLSFWDWVETVYQPDEIVRSFKANGMISRILSGVIRRE